MSNDLTIREKTQQAKTLDEDLRDMLLTKTLGDIVIMAEACSKQRVNAACTLIFNAIFGSKQNLIRKDKKSYIKPDIGLINELIKRVDGAIPDSEDRENYANLLGDALEKILDGNELGIRFTDIGIDAMAKAILIIALNEDPDMSVQTKKDRQAATEIWLSRTGGRKTKPASANVKVLYVDRDFTKSLGEVDNKE